MLFIDCSACSATDLRYYYPMKKKMTLNTQDKMVAGVLSGIADYFDVDVALIRLIGVATLIITVFFPFALFYICAWIILPKDTAGKPDYEIVD